MITEITTYSGLKYRCEKHERHVGTGWHIACQDCKPHKSDTGKELILAKDMVPGDIVRLTGDSGSPFMDMLVHKVEIDTGRFACGGKVHLLRPWMQNQPYPMTGHESFFIWRDSTNCTFWLMRESEERRAK